MIDVCIFCLVLQVMPILTTTYPLMNSTFNVSQHTLKLIQEKMLVAAEICDRILEGAQDQWETLFKVKQIVYNLFAYFNNQLFVYLITFRNFDKGRNTSEIFFPFVFLPLPLS